MKDTNIAEQPMLLPVFKVFRLSMSVEPRYNDVPDIMINIFKPSRNWMADTSIRKRRKNILSVCLKKTVVLFLETVEEV